MATKLTSEQINKAFIAIVGIPARAADIGVVEMLGATDSVLAEYLWDHWMGEPDSPTVTQIRRAVKEAIK